MRLGECSTQRNLDATGRAQARRIGEALRAQGVRVGAVLASEWCRTMETAELAFPGAARPEPAFNSFFADRAAGPSRTAEARARLHAWRGPGAGGVRAHPPLIQRRPRRAALRLAAGLRAGWAGGFAALAAFGRGRGATCTGSAFGSPAVPA